MSSVLYDLPSSPYHLLLGSPAAELDHKGAGSWLWVGQVPGKGSMTLLDFWGLSCGNSSDVFTKLSRKHVSTLLVFRYSINSYIFFPWSGFAIISLASKLAWCCVGCVINSVVTQRTFSGSSILSSASSSLSFVCCCLMSDNCALLPFLNLRISFKLFLKLASVLCSCGSSGC